MRSGEIDLRYGFLRYVGSGGAYSSQRADMDDGNEQYIYYLNISALGTEPSMSIYNNRAFGYSLRCLQE